MSNPITGEVRLNGAETFTLKFSTEALILVEEALDISVLELMTLLRRPRLKQVRVLLWAALHERHPLDSESEGLKRAGALIAEHGLVEVLEKLAEAIKAAFPRRDGKGGASGPQSEAAEAPPADGIGSSSSGSGSNLA